MTLHIFNPEHDIALASGKANFTAPHAGRQLRHDLGWLPACWKEQGDAVLVEDVDAAQLACKRRKLEPGIFVDKGMLKSLPIDRVEPWGWNAALRAELLRHGVRADILPTEEDIAAIRNLSHRRTASWLLPQLRTEGTLGEAWECSSIEEVESRLKQYGHLTLKAPWSSSGRGIRFLSRETPVENIHGWLRNLIRLQGTVMVEPYYNKVCDMGMEFVSDGKGHVSYEGLSLFHTANGAYTGNIIATERAKRAKISHYLSLELLDATQERICQLLGKAFDGKYQGPFGVDMMVVGASPAACLLHPCVEINLRHTMGHVALALGRKINPTDDDDIRRVMRIDYSNNCYKLNIKRL